ncbi:hypothetical protein ACJJI5_15600 [Microbulbifer sp. EKSA008]|uniref:hypothetical protein n=1 Tax=Microbulbifer sp. EKSA008 TaxID=3243367 RepID=UPI004042E8CB
MFRKWGKAATYDDGSGGESIDCRVIKDQEVGEFEEDERVRVPRVELNLLVSEVGVYCLETVVAFGGVEYAVRKMLSDDGVI